MQRCTLGRLGRDRRESARREPDPRETIANQLAFDQAERAGLKALERRRALRRGSDVRRRVAAIGS